jgi:uncharacterized protein YjbJ (UPF0337 family)
VIDQAEVFMNKNIVQGKWKEIKGKVKQQWGKLTDDDVTQMHGTYDELSGRLQKTYGYQKDQAEKEIDAFIENNGWDDTER